MIDVKRGPAPKSLATKKSWRGKDVRQQLHKDFLGKCYLTEERVSLSGFEIDHRHQRNQGGALYDWSNLYPASRDANNRRLRTWPVGGMLHPDGRDGVEARLVQKLGYDDDVKLICLFAAADVKDRQAINTAKELERLHNDDRSGIGYNASDLREAIDRRLKLMLDLQGQLLEAQKTLAVGELKLVALEQRFKRVVSRRSPFTALLRSKVVPSLRGLFD